MHIASKFSSLITCLFGPLLKKYRERVFVSKDDTGNHNNGFEKRTTESVVRTTLKSPPRSQQQQGLGKTHTDTMATENGLNKSNYSARSLLKSASISASKCVGVEGRNDSMVGELYKSRNLQVYFSFLVTEFVIFLKLDTKQPFNNVYVVGVC